MACFTITKYLLFGFNFIFWLAGAALLGVGVWILVDPNVAGTIQIAGLEFYMAGGILLAVAGGLMLIFGFFGCCGAIKESTCLLGTYFILILIVFALEVAAGIWALVTSATIQDVITTAMGKIDVNDPTDQNALISLQVNLKCCGTLNGCGDWEGFPDGLTACSCESNADNADTCIQVPPECAAGAGTSIYNQTCNDAAYQFIENNIIIIAGVGIGIGLLQIVGMIVTIGLCCVVKERRRVHSK